MRFWGCILFSWRHRSQTKVHEDTKPALSSRVRCISSTWPSRIVPMPPLYPWRVTAAGLACVPLLHIGGKFQFRAHRIRALPAAGPIWGPLTAEKWLKLGQNRWRASADVVSARSGRPTVGLKLKLPRDEQQGVPHGWTAFCF